MKDKNEIHVNVHTAKKIGKSDLQALIRTGKAIAALISSLDIQSMGKHLVNVLAESDGAQKLCADFVINKTSFPTPHLDIGGSGEEIIYKVSRNPITIIDLDFDREINSSRVEMHEMDAGDLKFEDDKFATVTSFYTLMYNCREDLPNIFKEAYRVLIKGGVIKIWDVYTTHFHGGFTNVSINVTCGKKKYHANYSSNAIEEVRNQDFYRELLSDAGFTNVSVHIHGHAVEIEAYKN